MRWTNWNREKSSKNIFCLNRTRCTVQHWWRKWVLCNELRIFLKYSRSSQHTQFKFFLNLKTNIFLNLRFLSKTHAWSWVGSQIVILSSKTSSPVQLKPWAAAISGAIVKPLIFYDVLIVFVQKYTCNIFYTRFIATPPKKLHHQATVLIKCIKEIILCIWCEALLVIWVSNHKNN